MSDQVHLNVESIEDYRVLLNFRTLPENQPATFANLIAVWEGESVVPWSAPPLMVKSVPDDTPSGQMLIKIPNDDPQRQGFRPKERPYVYGYSVGPGKDAEFTRYPNVVATAFTVPPGSAKPGFSSMISAGPVGAQSVQAMYAFPEGFNPADAGSEVAVWRGAATPGTTAATLVVSPKIDSTNSQGMVTLRFPVQGGTQYTLQLLATPEAYAVAASDTITT